MARTATLAHQAEMLDDHASDSNHKKTLNIVSSLCRSHTQAIDMFDHAKTYYRNLTDEAGPTAVEKWMNDIEDAKCQRKYNISAMNIYATKLNNSHDNNRHLTPGLPTSLLESWMELSLTVEEKQ